MRILAASLAAAVAGFALATAAQNDRTPVPVGQEVMAAAAPAPGEPSRAGVDQRMTQLEADLDKHEK